MTQHEDQQFPFNLSPSEKEDLCSVLASPYVVENYIKKFPGCMTIDVATACNAKCVFCAYPHNKDKKKIMNFDTFKKALDQANEIDQVNSVSFTPVAGDPLMNAELFDFIAYGWEQGVTFTNFASNGINLKKNDTYKKLIDSRLSQVLFSIGSGFDPNFYLRIFGVDKFKDVFEGVMKLARYKAESGIKDTEIIIGTGVPIGEAFWNSPYWKELLPYVKDGTVCIGGFKDYDALISFANQVPDPLPPGSSPKIHKNLIDNWSGAVIEENLPENWGVKPILHDSSYPPCEGVMGDLSVLSDGDVRVCACRYKHTVHDELVIGNIHEQSLSTILYGERHRDLINRISKGDWPEVCLDCTLYRPFRIPQDALDYATYLAKRHTDENVPVVPLLSSEVVKKIETIFEYIHYCIEKGLLDIVVQQVNILVDLSKRKQLPPEKRQWIDEEFVKIQTLLIESKWKGPSSSENLDPAIVVAKDEPPRVFGMRTLPKT